jgi:cell cycle sensor histidine kinase DivJ
MVQRRATSARTRRRTDRFAVLWHVAWALAVLAGAGGLVVAGRLPVGTEVAALGEGAAAALLGAGLCLMGGPGRTIAIVIWALAAAAATQMTGGIGGPLAAWCLAPLAAAAAFRRPTLLAVGAAASVGATAVAALGGVLLPLPSVVPEHAPWLSLLALGTTAVGFGAAAVALMGRIRGELRRAETTELALIEMLENQPQLVLNLAADGTIAAAHGPPLAGAPSRELVGRAFSDLAEPRARAALEAAIQSATDHGSAELSFTPAADSEGSHDVALRRIPGGRLIAALSDGRAHRAREQELERARDSAEQQNAGKSRFLANMSHELRTPLNAVMGFADIMRQRLFGPLGDRYVEYAELIHESGSHLLELINDVLDMSKIEAERYELFRERFDARESVQAVLRLMRGQAERAGVHLRAVLPVEALEADADRRALKQIAINLVSNALKFTPRGGSVTVTAQRAGDQLEIIVSDTGVGIDPADLQRLGNPFEQAGDAEHRAAGSGLGLSLVQAFARLHDGEMNVESAVGEGTTVTVRLPVLLPAEAPERVREAKR